jgi:hypothetical protein
VSLEIANAQRCGSQYFNKLHLQMSLLKNEFSTKITLAAAKKTIEQLEGKTDEAETNIINVGNQPQEPIIL